MCSLSGENFRHSSTAVLSSFVFCGANTVVEGWKLGAARACGDRGDVSRENVDGESLKKEKAFMGHVYSPLQEAGKVATKSARNRAGMQIYMHVCA